MRRPVIFVLSAFVLTHATSLLAEEEKILNIGDAPPAITVSSWVKGDKVEKLEPGKTYVVEFWATWCGPCRGSIPHLTELAHKYKGKVQFVGVDVWEGDQSLVKPFVEEMGEKMDYSVAMDIVPQNPENQFVGKMAKTWMDAAEQHGIPTAFVIRDGKIAWIGHPMKMEEPLEKILAGNWEYEAQAKERLAIKTEERKVRLVEAKVDTPFEAKDYKAAVAAIDAIVKDDPSLANAFASKKFAALCFDGQNEEALKVGQQVIDHNWDKAASLNECFWDVVDPELKEVDPQIAQLALKAMRRAVELTKEDDSAILDTLAVAQFRTGDATGAISTEEKAIRVEKSKEKPVEGWLQQYGERIEWFRGGDAKKKDSV
jgi:thiol-disulfide isomerase/thioredoxin